MEVELSAGGFRHAARIARGSDRSASFVAAPLNDAPFVVRVASLPEPPPDGCFEDLAGAQGGDVYLWPVGEGHCYTGLRFAAGAPLVLNAILDRSLAACGFPQRIDLADAFLAFAGEEPAYAARSSDPATVAVLVEDGALAVVALKAGTATVTVTATTADGFSATRTFTVDAEDGGPEAVGELPGLHLRVGSFGARDLAGAFIPDDDLAYGARSSDVRVAAVEVVGSTTLRVVALGAGDAEVVVGATDLNGKSAESAFAVAVAELAISEEITLEADGESFSVDLSQLFPHMDWATTTAVAPKSNRPHVVAVRVRNQELLLVPGENEGVAEIVVTAAHDSGWQTTHRLHATVEVAPRPAFRGWRMILLRDAASDESDR